MSPSDCRKFAVGPLNNPQPTFETSVDEFVVDVNKVPFNHNSFPMVATESPTELPLNTNDQIRNGSVAGVVEAGTVARVLVLKNEKLTEA
jgi:hypothetical protein